MSSTNYPCKSNVLTVEEYSHKKFAKHTNKRKQKEMEDKENEISVQTILEMANNKTEQPSSKRKQTKALFRPWLDDEVTIKETKPSTTTKVLKPTASNQIKARTQQTKWNRQQLAQLIHQYNQQAQQYLLQQQYYAYYQQQQVAAAKLRHTIYLQQLQQQVLTSV
ncbi:putative transcriptional regulator cudA [Lucilia cuprina]|uniref:putative transcriptional regulator cudA n=1 Tax=Lucilia cuprina TaxID=7375 RepID=UPI001F06AB27|nr:putative transcriptional regulator cudA [Lucilia cuprina]